MFTIKHLTPFGNEGIFAASDVAFSPTEGVTRPAHQQQTGTLFYRASPGDTYNELRDGKAYVMNDGGATVAVYDMGGWATPGATGSMADH